MEGYETMTTTKPPTKAEREQALRQNVTAVLGLTEDSNAGIEIGRHKKRQIILPQDWDLQQAIDEIREIQCALATESDTRYQIHSATVEDALIAVDTIIADVFGYSVGRMSRDFFGNMEPPRRELITAPDGTEYNVSIRKVKLPGIDGTLDIFPMQPETSTQSVGCHVVVNCRRRDLPLIDALMDRVKAYAKENSIYASAPVTVSCAHQREGREYEIGADCPQPFPTSILPRDIIVNHDVAAQLEAIWTVITHTKECRKAGIPINRGILLHGTYGTGKSLTAAATASVCGDSDWGFLLAKSVDDLAHAIALAHRLKKPAVVFVEDVDRAFSEERNKRTDELLNIIDGVSAKSSEIILIMTTNDLHGLDPAMLRPGRIDALIEMSLPDAESAIRLARMYAGDLLPENVDLTEVGNALAGSVPAMIRESVERSKLLAIGRTGSADILGAQDILDTAQGLVGHRKALQTATERALTHETKADRFAKNLGKAMGTAIGVPLQEITGT